MYTHIHRHLPIEQSDRFDTPEKKTQANNASTCPSSRNFTSLFRHADTNVWEFVRKCLSEWLILLIWMVFSSNTVLFFFLHRPEQDNWPLHIEPLGLVVSECARIINYFTGTTILEDKINKKTTDGIRKNDGPVGSFRNSFIPSSAWRVLEFADQEMIQFEDTYIL